MAAIGIDERAEVISDMDDAEVLPGGEIRASRITRCFIWPRQGHEGPPLFHALGNGLGDVKVNLDGYAIIPIEEYEDLRRRAGDVDPPPAKRH